MKKQKILPRILMTLAILVMGGYLNAAPLSHSFPSIDGGILDLSDWSGQPVLVVNTASQCAFTKQYEDLQSLYDTYREDGLIVLAVPSDDFRQELSTAAEVKEFCEMTFGIDFPMADITHVKGRNAHPFYAEVRNQSGFVPGWNFNKILIGKDGSVRQTWGSGADPMGSDIRSAIEAELNG